MKGSAVLKKDYWSSAVRNCKDIKMLAVAAVITALRIAVKAFSIPILSSNLVIAFSCYFDVVGSLIYGPVLALFSGAVSDTVGAFLFPLGDYFFPYIFPEMLGSFIYAIFLWRREKITVSRVLLSRFAVNIICNIFLNSVIMKWQFILYGGENVVYLFTTVRVAKNLIMFPLEGVLMAVIISAALPPLRRIGIIEPFVEGERMTAKNIFAVVTLFLISVGLVLLYVFCLRDLLAAHNIQLL